MSSKRYSGKTCPYCGVEGSSATRDHVIAKCFFPRRELISTPIVPACEKCNNEKSSLETYVSATLVAGSQHDDADEYRRNVVSRRIAKNRAAQIDLGIHNPPQLMFVNGVLRPMHALRIDAKKVKALMEMIVRGLYFHHFGKALATGFYPDIAMFGPEREGALWASVADAFPPTARRFTVDLGKGTFWYEMAQSSLHEAFTAWRIRWHGGIALHGENTPPEGVSVWWVMTRPTEELLAAQLLPPAKA